MPYGIMGSINTIVYICCMQGQPLSKTCAIQIAIKMSKNFCEGMQRYPNESFQVGQTQ